MVSEKASFCKMNIDLNQIKKVLIVQIRPFGDVLLNTSYFPFLRKKLPDAKIDFLVCRPYHKILENNPCIDEVVVFNRKKRDSWSPGKSKTSYSNKSPELWSYNRPTPRHHLGSDYTVQQGQIPDCLLSCKVEISL